MLPDYAELRRRVRAAGLLERSYRYYAVLSGVLVAGIALIGVLVVFLPGAGDVLAVPAMALVLMQIGFLGHDAGHNGIFERTRHNRIVGFITHPLLLGISFENWVAKHNAHHAHTNEVGRDPDISHPIVAYTPEEAARRRGLLRWVVRRQAWLFFPMALFATLAFRFDAWQHAIRKRHQVLARWEGVCILANLGAWIIAPSLLLGPGRWLLVFGASQLLLGVYMAAVFAPNHKGMPLIRGRRPGFLEQQVLTSRNVRGGTVVDILFGGLNYQIEHHLFPNMARNRLPACQGIVVAFCREAGLSHVEEGVVESYRSLLSQLDAIGRGESAPELLR